MKAVNRPGSLYRSAAATALSHTGRTICGSFGSQGNSPREKESIISSAAATAVWPPSSTMPFQRRPSSLAIISGSPAISIGKKPMPSEWSEITRKSSGRPSLTRSPVAETTSSPRAKR